MLQIRCPQSLQELWSIVLREGQGMEPEQDIGWQAPGKQGKFTFILGQTSCNPIVLGAYYPSHTPKIVHTIWVQYWNTQSTITRTVQVIVEFYIRKYSFHRSTTYTNLKLHAVASKDQRVEVVLKERNICQKFVCLCLQSKWFVWGHCYYFTVH